MSREEFVELHEAESYLPEYMGWTDIDSDDGVCLRGFDPMNGRLKLIRSHVWDEQVTAWIRDVITEVMKYADGTEIGYRLEGKRWEMRASFYPIGTESKWRAFEATSEYARKSTAIAALRLFKALGPLPNLPDWYACKKVRKAYLLNPYKPKSNE